MLEAKDLSLNSKSDAIWLEIDQVSGSSSSSVTVTDAETLKLFILHQISCNHGSGVNIGKPEGLIGPDTSSISDSLVLKLNPLNPLIASLLN